MKCIYAIKYKYHNRILLSTLLLFKFLNNASTYDIGYNNGEDKLEHNFKLVC